MFSFFLGLWWSFSLNRVAIEPQHTYLVSIYNVPEPEIGDYRASRQITIPSEQPVASAILKSWNCEWNKGMWTQNWTQPHLFRSVNIFLPNLDMLTSWSRRLLCFCKIVRCTPITVFKVMTSGIPGLVCSLPVLENNLLPSDTVIKLVF